MNSISIVIVLGFQWTFFKNCKVKNFATVKLQKYEKLQKKGLKSHFFKRFPTENLKNLMAILHKV